MNDQFTDLEAELATMRPQPLPPAIIERIAADLQVGVRHSQGSDRCLLGAIGAGAIAACVIFATLIVPAAPPLESRSSKVAVAPASDPPRAGDYALVIARAQTSP